MARSVLFAIPLLFFACGGLPDYAMPQERAHAPGARASADSIRYRDLRRGDFKAKRPPAQYGAHAERMGAYTCGNIVAEEPIAIRIEPDGRRYVARAPTLEIHAEMDRRCSWWNAKLRDAQPPEYILQHEQIHFALFELAARDMQARGRAIAARGATVEAAHAAFQRALDRMREDATQAMLDRNADFDRDCSGVHDPRAQQRWYDRVRAELAR